jgi:hypothetical protein
VSGGVIVDRTRHRPLSLAAVRRKIGAQDGVVKRFDEREYVDVTEQS